MSWIIGWAVVSVALGLLLGSGLYQGGAAKEQPMPVHTIIYERGEHNWVWMYPADNVGVLYRAVVKAVMDPANPLTHYDARIICRKAREGATPQVTHEWEA